MIVEELKTKEAIMNKEREQELMELVWAESDDQETQEWRDELSFEESKFVDELDDEISGTFENLIREISKAINS